jgi:hypothetical protein
MTNAELVTKILTANKNFIWACKLDDKKQIAQYKQELADLKKQLNTPKAGA